MRAAAGPAPLAPNMGDYDAERRGFTWTGERAALDGLPGGGLNIAHEAVDRHARADVTAIRWLGRDGARRDISYSNLSDLTGRFANALRGLGMERGDRVFALAGRIPELYVAALGTLKLGAVFCPLFSAFGPEPVRQRLDAGGGRVLVTTPALYRKRVAPVRDQLPALDHVLLVGDPDEIEAIEGAHDLLALLASASGDFELPATQPGDMALLHFTSGTTGTPKGAVHVHEAVVAHYATGRIALDLHPGDVYWCTADPGWVTGTSYGIIAPLVHGVTLLVDEGEFDAARWYRTLEREKVDVWYTAPTAIRMLMRAGAEVAGEFDLSRVRFAASVGEPLNPEAIQWAERELGLRIHDNWWQTETGGIMIANYRALPIRPGSMGKPLPGIDATILLRKEDEEGELLTEHGSPVEAPVGVVGELALRTPWPSMFRGYLGQDERYRRCFTDGWYRSGDLARVDEDGYFWFVARGDDVIKSAGHLIGPFEVESVLMEHPQVVEAGVIGKPDPIAGAVIKAFVVPVAGVTPDDALRRDVIAFARKRLGAAVAPREVAFTATLPQTRSGKVMRRLLRARELGLPEGDTSTLEAKP
jgi:acetyl-CoA synthetase